MGLEIVDVSDGLMTVKVTGVLKKSELDRAQASAREIIKRHGKVRFLVIVEDFRGWQQEGRWGDVSLEMEYDEHIEKIAIVGEEQWEYVALAFVGKGVRPGAIECFPPSDLARARAWVGSKP